VDSGPLVFAAPVPTGGASSALLSDADWVIWAVFLGEFMILAAAAAGFGNCGYCRGARACPTTRRRTRRGRSLPESATGADAAAAGSPAGFAPARCRIGNRSGARPIRLREFTS